MKRLFRQYLHSHHGMAQFLRFATVGVKISLIDAGLLYLLPFWFSINLYSARVISLGTAIIVGYLLNRYFTFGGNERGCFYRQMAGHVSVHLTGGLINYGTFSLVIFIGHSLSVNKLLMTLLPLLGIWIGGIVGLIFNFIFSKRFVFQKQTKEAPSSQ